MDERINYIYYSNTNIQSEFILEFIRIGFVLSREAQTSSDVFARIERNK